MGTPSDFVSRQNPAHCGLDGEGRRLERRTFFPEGAGRGGWSSLPGDFFPSGFLGEGGEVRPGPVQAGLGSQVVVGLGAKAFYGALLLPSFLLGARTTTQLGYTIRTEEALCKF